MFYGQRLSFMPNWVMVGASNLNQKVMWYIIIRCEIVYIIPISASWY